MKDLKVRLISELMKNSRRSDRELAKAIGTSQPTVSRIIHKLEKEGIIKEYTILPDFKKLGIPHMCLHFCRFSNPSGSTIHERAARRIRKKTGRNS